MTIFGKAVKNDCLFCGLSGNSDVLSDERIFRSEFFDIYQDVGLAIPGLMIVSPLRHVPNVEALSDDELAELGLLMVYCKKALVDIWELEKVVFQINDKPNNHVHLVIVPLWKEFRSFENLGVLEKLEQQKESLKQDEKNLLKVKEYVLKLRTWFEERLG